MKYIKVEDILSMEKRYKTTFLNSISGFKSLQMVATINKQGKSNIALFNSIFHVGANPPYIGMVVRPDAEEHETLINIEETGFYTLNNVTERFYEQAHQTSARYKAGQSEFENCGFTEEFTDDFKAPFVKESNVKLGLSLKEIIPLSFNGTKIIIGEVKCVLLDDQIIKKDGYVDLAKAGSITVAGLDAYHSTELLARLSYAKPEKHPEKIDV